MSSLAARLALKSARKHREWQEEMRRLYPEIAMLEHQQMLERQAAKEQRKEKLRQFLNKYLRYVGLWIHNKDKE